MSPLSKHHTQRYQRSMDDLRHDMWQTVSSSLLKKRAVGGLQRRISGTWSFPKDLLKRKSMSVFKKSLTLVTPQQVTPPRLRAYS